MRRSRTAEVTIPVPSPEEEAHQIEGTLLDISSQACEYAIDRNVEFAKELFASANFDKSNPDHLMARDDGLALAVTKRNAVFDYAGDDFLRSWKPRSQKLFIESCDNLLGAYRNAPINSATGSNRAMDRFIDLSKAAGLDPARLVEMKKEPLRNLVVNTLADEEKSDYELDRELESLQRIVSDRLGVKITVAQAEETDTPIQAQPEFAVPPVSLSREIMSASQRARINKNARRAVYITSITAVTVGSLSQPAAAQQRAGNLTIAQPHSLRVNALITLNNKPIDLSSGKIVLSTDMEVAKSSGTTEVQLDKMLDSVIVPISDVTPVETGHEADETHIPKLDIALGEKLNISSSAVLIHSADAGENFNSSPTDKESIRERIRRLAHMGSSDLEQAMADEVSAGEQAIKPDPNNTAGYTNTQIEEINKGIAVPTMESNEAAALAPTLANNPNLLKHIDQYPLTSEVLKSVMDNATNKFSVDAENGMYSYIQDIDEYHPDDYESFDPSQRKAIAATLAVMKAAGDGSTSGATDIDLSTGSLSETVNIAILSRSKPHSSGPQHHEPKHGQTHEKHASEHESISERRAEVKGLVEAGVPEKYAVLYVKYGHMYDGVTPAFLAAQGFHESGYIDKYVYGWEKSSANAIGIAQFLQGTFDEYARILNFPAEAKPSIPRYAIQAQAKMMSGGIHKAAHDTTPHGLRYATFASPQRVALSAYNTGWGNVDKWGHKNHIPGYTLGYVDGIMNTAAKMQSHIDDNVHKHHAAKHHKTPHAASPHHTSRSGEVPDNAQARAAYFADKLGINTSDITVSVGNSGVAHYVVHESGWRKLGIKHLGGYPSGSQFASGASPRSFYYGECVDYVAWKIDHDGIKNNSPDNWGGNYSSPYQGGNAMAWDNNARADHIKVNDKLATGAAIIWNPNGPEHNSVGHAAYVEKAFPEENWAVYSQMNYDGNSGWNVEILSPQNIDMLKDQINIVHFEGKHHSSSASSSSHSSSAHGSHASTSKTHHTSKPKHDSVKSDVQSSDSGSTKSHKIRNILEEPMSNAVVATPLVSNTAQDSSVSSSENNGDTTTNRSDEQSHGHKDKSKVATFIGGLGNLLGR